MAHAHAHDPIETRKEYFRIFKYLVILTVLEVGFVFLPIPKIFVTLLVVVASCSKAALVGYYYMHLKSETLWLKLVALLPIIMFGYLAVLGPDAAQRRFNVYLNEPPRILPSHEEHKPHAAKHGTAAEAQQEALKVREINVGPGNEKAPEAPVKSEASEWGAPEAATAPAMGAQAPTGATAPAAAPSTESAPGSASADEFR